MPNLDGTGFDKVKEKQALDAFGDAEAQKTPGSGQGEAGSGPQDETGRSTDFVSSKSGSKAAIKR